MPRIWQRSSALLALVVFALPALAPRASAEPSNWVRYVNPFIGTDDSRSPHPVPGGAGGSTFPGATVPFGMVQLSPDTPTASPSGYRYGDTSIEAFSLTHFNGAGCPNNEDLPFLPMVGDLETSPGTHWSDYASPYAKSTESASPGSYAVRLARSGILVELTATARTGLARFTFPPTNDARVLLHTGRSATGDREGSLEITAPDRIEGSVTAGGFCGSRTSFPIYFVVEFDRAFREFGTWCGDDVAEGRARVDGSPTGGYVTFDTTADSTVQMKVGLSYVSIANAAANLRAENPDWSFESVRASAERKWNDVLGRIEVHGGSDEDLTRFYTALYHVFVNPNLASDVDGEYMGFDGVVHSAERPTYQNYSGWDIIRSWTHLIGAIAPEAPDILASMVQDGIEGGLLPFWSHESVETQVMVGDPGTVNVANAYAMGVRGFDERAAFELMKKSADDPEDTQRWGLGDWLDLHYVGNAAISLEYAMADFALSRFAGALGEDDDAQRYRKRSGYWRNLWNGDDGYLEPRAGGMNMGADAARIYEVEVYGPDSPDSNLARAGSATASGTCNDHEGPEKAINGSWDGGTSDKWCDNQSGGMWWLLDLGEVRRIDRIVIRHAGAGGESSDWNTQDFDLAVSENGADFTTVAAVRGNRADVSTHDFAPTDARFVRLDVVTEIQRGVVIGDWDCQPFDPAAQCGFVEGNGAQYLWMVPHDLAGLIDLMGGAKAATERLDDLFAELNAGTNRSHFYIGNEPEHGTPWTYNFTGTPWKTQAVVRRILDEEFGTGPGGLPGNDDLGSTSAWVVWASLGLYPMIPGTDILVLSGPVLPTATVHLANGNTLRIVATGEDPEGSYIQSVRVGDAPLRRSWLRFAEISDGTTLDFQMARQANHEWGSRDQDLPPSFPPPEQ
jgi:predicted alpha-1,2-mannosidase